MARSTAARFLVLGTALTVTLTGCGGDSGGPAPVATTITVSPSPATVQSGSTLTLNAVVLDQNGRPMTGQTVTWSSSNNDKATVSPSGIVTGKVVGTAAITASAGTATSAPTTVTVTNGPASSLMKLAGLATIQAGASDSVRLRVVDAHGNGVPNIAVSLAVTGGGATISAISRVTDANGFAGALLTAGNTVGQQITVTATAPGLAALTFVVNIVPGVPTRLLVTSPRVIIIDQGGTTTLALSLTDAAGNPISTASGITYVSRTPAVAPVSGTGAVTGVSPGQSIVVAEVNGYPAVRDSMLVVVAAASGVVVRTDLMRFDLKADTTFTIGIFVDMRASGERLGSTRLQLSWNPTTLTYLGDAEGAAGAGATVNSSNAVAGGILTLALANAAGFAGSVELRRVTFRASVTTARTTPLVLAASELNGVAPSFADLKPKTVGVSHPIITR